jgi:GT2 family glycosyltransferase
VLECRIPYAEGGNLGAEYNRIMADASADVVMLLDHDVLLLNPHWHHILSRIFADNPRAGLVTCWTNNIGTKHQKRGKAPPGHDIARHRGYAREMWDAFGYGTTSIPSCGGMLMALRRDCWRDVGPFSNGFFSVDHDYARRVAASQWQLLRADGLYVYHVRDRKDGTWIDGQKTSKEFL